MAADTWDWTTEGEPIDWGRIVLDSLSNGLILAGANQELDGYDRLSQTAALIGVEKGAALDFEAAQYDEKAGQAVAASQRAAWNEKRNGRLVQSRLVALVAAGGGSATDVIDLSARISTEAAYRAQTATYQGMDAARTARLQAMGKRYEAAIAVQQGQEKADAYTALKSGTKVEVASTLASKYAPAIVSGVNAGVGALVDWVSADSADSPPPAVGDAMSPANDLGFFNWG